MSQNIYKTSYLKKNNEKISLKMLVKIDLLKHQYLIIRSSNKMFYYIKYSTTYY